jgi:hypothetical protein
VLDIGTPDQVVSRRNLRGAEIETKHAYRAAEMLRSHPAVDEVAHYGNVLRLTTREGADPASVVREAIGDAIDVGAIRPVRVGVEDAFVSMVRADASEDAPKSKRPSAGANAP